MTKKEETQIPLADFNECLKIWGTEIVSLACPKCKKNTAFKKTYHFKTWPKYLIVNTLRIKFDDDWVVKKDNTELVFKSEYEDFSSYVYPKPDSDDFKLEGDVVDTGPKIDQEALNQLLAMEFGENRAKRALIQTNNNVEAAINWLFEKMDDMTLDEPLPQEQSSKSGGDSYDPEIISLIQGMGFNEKEAKYALKQCDGNPDRAVEYLFNHPEVSQLIAESESSTSSAPNPFDKAISEFKNPLYQLKSSIVHLGRNYQSGHYVCYINKKGQWVYYNDAKVAGTTDPAIGKGTVYVLERVDN